MFLTSRILAGAWGMRPEAVFGQDRRRDLEIVRLVREVIGDELELVVDTPGARGILRRATRYHIECRQSLATGSRPREARSDAE